MMSMTQGDVRIGGCIQRLPGDALVLEQALVFQRGKWVHKARISFLAAVMGEAYGAAMAVVSTAFAPCPGGGLGAPAPRTQGILPALRAESFTLATRPADSRASSPRTARPGT
jgi:hypothetical protein